MRWFLLKFHREGNECAELVCSRNRPCSGPARVIMSFPLLKKENQRLREVKEPAQDHCGQVAQQVLRRAPEDYIVK